MTRLGARPIEAMLSRIAAFFEQHFLLPETEAEQTPVLQRAIAALLLEITYSDGEEHERERRAVKMALASTFDLQPNEVNDLVQLATEEHENATDSYPFIRLINQHYSAEQRVKLVEMLWTIAYADQELHHYEEHLVRRLADLLYVPHQAFIAAKHRAARQSRIVLG
jgi:uncharacterized tellurite resistance protein B-like protein